MPKLKPKIYCDTNIYSRPFDKLTYGRIDLEATACLKIFNLAYENKIVLMNSDILKYEINHADVEKQLLIQPLLKLCKSNIRQTIKIRNLAKFISQDIKLAPRDALHLASAINDKVNFFLTCDDEIIRKAKNISINHIIIINPIEFIYQYEK